MATGNMATGNMVTGNMAIDAEKVFLRVPRVLSQNISARVFFQKTEKKSKSQTQVNFPFGCIKEQMKVTVYWLSTAY